MKLAVCSRIYMLILNRWETYQRCAASSQKLHVVCRHCFSLAVSKRSTDLIKDFYYFFLNTKEE